MPTSRLAATLLALLTVSLPAWAGEQSIQLIGWSADEQRFAVRVYTDETSDMEAEEAPFCPGYVNHQGRKFRGSLTLAVYDKDQKPTGFPIQDSGKCTPPKKAKERLEKAKKELATLGIDLNQKKPGTELTPDKKGLLTINEGPGAPYTLEAEEQVEETLEGVDPFKKPKTQEEREEQEYQEAVADRHVKGELVVFVRQGSERRKLLSQKVEGRFTPMQAGHHETKLYRVWLSPSGKTVVFITRTSSGNMRDLNISQQVLGTLRWEGVPLVLR